MVWTDRLRQASFKGIEFRVEDHEADIGRRLVVNEYAYRDTPYTEDMGRRARRWNITAYLIGDDYMSARDDLMDAIEDGGVGTLIHPYLGTKEVICETARVREVKNEGRFVLVAMNFVEAGSRTFPNSSPVPADLVAAEADSVISLARTDFVENMTVSGVPEWVREAYNGTLSEVADIFSTIRKNGGINKQTTTALINQAAIWVADVADLSVPTQSTISDVESTADKMIETFKGVFELAPSNEVALRQLDEFTGFTADRNGGTTAQATTIDNNALVSENFVKTVSLANTAKALVSSSFPSFEDAVASRQTVLDRIDTIAGATKNDDIFNNLRSLRAEVAAAVPGEDNSLPRISNVQLKQSKPSLVLAYDLYEGVDREQEIIDRNRIRRPAFMPGGDRLSVLQYEQNRS